MLDLLLQLWGGALYLSNKVLFALSEGGVGDRARKQRIAAWIIYILGVPAWVIVLIGKHDWIAASIEAGGVPAMLLGLYNACYGHGRVSTFWNAVVTTMTYGFLLLGLGTSLWYHGGLVALSQFLEIGVMMGFLLGSYYLAKGLSKGWLFFMLMNVSMAALMGLQDKHVLMGQQLLSLCFVIYGFRKTLRNKLEGN